MNRLKKVMALLLAASSIAGCAVSLNASADTMGDVDENGTVDANDALMALAYSVDLAYLSDSQFARADINYDGAVDSDDAFQILRKSVTDDGEDDYSDVSSDLFGTKTQVAEMEGWGPAEIIERVGPLFTADQEKTGVLASVSLAQFIIESGYGQSKLSIEANNCFGMKGSVCKDGWDGEYWDGQSLYTIETEEQRPDGSTYTITADFRMYDCMENSIGDHSEYLITSMNGDHLRYEGLQGCTDYRKAAQIIKEGGYATAVSYVDVICSVIESWDLTRYDSQNVSSYSVIEDSVPTDQEERTLYRVRLSWEDWQSQVGAYYFLENAIECADDHPGYSVYDEEGISVYTSESYDVYIEFVD